MKTFLVTGADRGIGEALCREIHARGDRVIAACLGDSESLRDHDMGSSPRVDVTSDVAIRRGLAERLAGSRLDVLINNAGVVELCELGRLDFAKLRREYEVNALGPLRVTQALLGVSAKARKSRSSPAAWARSAKTLGRPLRLSHVEGGGEHGGNLPGTRSRRSAESRSSVFTREASAPK